MATTRYNVTSSWLLVATSDQQFLVDNVSSGNVDITLKDSLPSSDTLDYTVLVAGQGMVRMGLTGNLYVRKSYDNTLSSDVVVMT